jgi:hypothetical protein
MSMKRVSAVVWSAVVGVLIHGVPAHAGLCAPQTAFASTTLQSQLNTFGESIDVLTDQQDGLVWGTNASLNATMSIIFQLAGNPNQDEFGIAGLNPTGGLAGLCAVFPAGDFNTGYFAVASFRGADLLTVNLFNASARVINTTTYTGVDRTRFLYYVKNAEGTFFSHPGFNTDGKVHSLVFAGTTMNRGSWWMAWEDSVNPPATADYGDGLLFLESLNPTPVAHATWASLKARFR